MTDDPTDRVERVRRALDDFLNRLARTVVAELEALSPAELSEIATQSTTDARPSKKSSRRR
jgi:uncharacterized hydantoinase/oxoprolinase family protein